MDQNSLLQAIKLILSGNQQSLNQGQQFIEQNQLQQNYCINLMMITDNQSNTINERQFAVTNLKTTIDSFWNPNSKRPKSLEQNEKNTIKMSILDALIRSASERKLSKIYESIIYAIALFDYPKQWPEILPNVLEKLKSSESFDELYGSLLVLLNIFKVYQLHIPEDTVHLEFLVVNSFPVLMNLTTKLLSSYNDQTASLMKAILKIYHCSIFMELLPCLAQEQPIQHWLSFFKLILDAQIPPELEAVSASQYENDLKERNFLWKCKKWVGRIMQKFVQQYANASINRNQKEFAQMFQSKYGVSFLESFMAFLLKRKTHFVSNAMTHFSLKYVLYSLLHDQTFLLLQPHLEKVMFDICLPLLAFSAQDNEQWQSDPEEYLRKEDDQSQHITNNKNAAMDLVEHICRRRDAQRNYFVHLFVNYCTMCLQSGADPRTNEPISPAFREGLLFAFGKLKTEIEKRYKEEGQIEKLLETFILPEFGSQFGMIRARACWVYGKFADRKFQNTQATRLAVEGICKCLMSNELPVKVKGAIALDCMLTQQTTVDYILPNLTDVLSIFIKMMDEYDSEDLVLALDGLVESFAEEITPFAFNLCDHLIKAFYKFVDKQQQSDQNPFQQQQQGEADQDEDDDENDDEHLAAAQCLSSVRKILDSPLQKDVYQSLETLLLPVVNMVLASSNTSYIEECFGLLNLLVFKQDVISPQLWFYFPVLTYIVTGIPEHVLAQATPALQQLPNDLQAVVRAQQKSWGLVYTEQIISPFKNYVARGGQAFFGMKDIFGNGFLDLLLAVIDEVHSAPDNKGGQDEVSMMCVTTLYIALIENNIGKVDSLIPIVVNRCYDRIVASQTRSKQLRVVNIEVISLCMWYNPFIAFQVLEARGVTAQLFQQWFDLLPQFKSDYDKQRMMLGLASILQLPQNQIPPAIQNSFNGLVKYLVKLTTEILQVREVEDDDDDYDNNDDLDSVDEEEEDLQKQQQNYDRTLKQLQKYTANKGEQQQQQGAKSQQMFSPGDLNSTPSTKAGNEDDFEDEDDEDYDYEDDPALSKYNLKYISPLEEVDDILYLEQQLINLMNSNNQFYQSVMSCLDETEMQTLQKNFATAHEQYNEYLKNKQSQQQQHGNANQVLVN